ncbi:hypothetical protein E2562_036467 [Oryza meyeriana var. granulata]|uniref:indole-3-pyruvate monooxygenase n=1 Tax=Oryza meyeriana var. granulata TaxID=110450 RepID=A0A6G1ET94_9ORYZ|nr:hypothetical protein E2562_036467 [Oryza meyeriana var. granulata]
MAEAPVMGEVVAEEHEHEEEVIVVGAGVSGLATAACLSLRGVPSCLVLDPRCRTRRTPTYLPRDDFVRYLDAYATRFGVRSRLRREVRAARFDEARGRWLVDAADLTTGRAERYVARYLVAAAGENDERVVPEVPGMETFPGKAMHAADYRCAEGFKGKSALVVGCGNSGMEIAYDLADSGVATSIVVRGEVHLMTRWILNVATSPLLIRYLPLWAIDNLVLLLCYLVFGDTSRYGLRRPATGPFSMRLLRPDVFPVLDVGTFSKIKSDEIRVLPAITRMHGSDVEFADGKRHAFDAIVFATGYRSTTKNDDGLIGDDGMAARRSPNHWKGENGLYCAGMNRRGIYGSGVDAELIAGDISRQRESKLQPQDEQRDVAAPVPSDA